MSAVGVTAVLVMPSIDRMADLGLSHVWEGKYSNVAAWYEHLKARPAFQAQIATSKPFHSSYSRRRRDNESKSGTARFTPDRFESSTHTEHLMKSAKHRLIPIAAAIAAAAVLVQPSWADHHDEHFHGDIGQTRRWQRR